MLPGFNFNGYGLRRLNTAMNQTSPASLGSGNPLGPQTAAAAAPAPAPGPSRASVLSGYGIPQLHPATTGASGRTATYTAPAVSPNPSRTPFYAGAFQTWQQPVDKMNLSQPGDPLRWWAKNGTPGIIGPGAQAQARPSLPGYGSGGYYGAAAPTAPAPATRTIGTPRQSPQAAAPAMAGQPAMATTTTPPTQPGVTASTAGQPAQPGQPGWTSGLAGGAGNTNLPVPTPYALPSTGNPRTDAMIKQVQQQQLQANLNNNARYNEALRLNDQGGQMQMADQNASLYGLQGDILSGQNAKLGYLNQAQDQLQGMLSGQRAGQLGFADAQHGTMSDLASQYGSAERAASDRALKESLGTIQQNAINAGLDLSSVPNNQISSAYNDSAIRNMQIDENAANRMLGVEQGYTGQRLGLMSNLDSSQLGMGQNFANTGYGAVGQAANDIYSTDANYAANRNSTLNGLRQDREGIIQARTDQGPDVGLAASMLSQARGGYNPYLSAYGMGQFGGAGGYNPTMAAMAGMRRTGGNFRAGANPYGNFLGGGGAIQQPYWGSATGPAGQLPPGYNPGIYDLSNMVGGGMDPRFNAANPLFA